MVCDHNKSQRKLVIQVVVVYSTDVARHAMQISTNHDLGFVTRSNSHKSTYEKRESDFGLILQRAQQQIVSEHTQAKAENSSTQALMNTTQCRCDISVILALTFLLTYKGKEEYLYSAFLAKVVHSKRSGMDHTVLPANNTMPAFPS